MQMAILRCFAAGGEMVSSTGGSLWSRMAEAAQLPPRCRVPLCAEAFPSALLGPDGHLGTAWPSSHPQRQPWTLNRIRPREAR